LSTFDSSALEYAQAGGWKRTENLSLIYWFTEHNEKN